MRLCMMKHIRTRICILILALLLPLLAGAADSIVVVVNQANGVDSLSRTDVINIFMGRFREFPSGIAAQPIDMPASATRTQFYRTLVKKEPAEINAYWARLVFAGRTSPPIQAESPGDALRMLRANPSGIAYMERSQVTNREKIVFELPAL